MTVALPLSTRLAWWGTSWLRGRTTPDDLLDAVLGEDTTHVVLRPGAAEPLLPALAALRSAGASGFGAAYPREGLLAGLGGPAAFNTAALEQGEAVVAIGAGIGLVPRRVGAAVEWSVLAAERRQLPDVGEADRELRRALVETAQELADLDVARWRPEIADELTDLRRIAVPATPAGVPHRCAELVGRALLAMRVADLALQDDGGAVTGHEAERRRTAISGLDATARRALVAASSPEVWPPGQAD